MMQLVVLLVLAGAVQLNVQSSLVSMASTTMGSGIRAVPLMRGYEPPDELASQLTAQNSSVAAAISSSLFVELAAAQERRVVALARVPGSTLVEVSTTRELDVVRNFDRDDPLDRGADAKVVDAGGVHAASSARSADGAGLIEHADGEQSTDGDGNGNGYNVMEQSVQVTATADIGLLSVRDTQYMGWIRVGTETAHDGTVGIPMRVVFDTGSTNLWVTGKKCPKNLLDKYDRDESKTRIKAKEYLVKIKFGTGQLEGVTVKDRVSVGPFSIPAANAGDQGPSGQGFGLIEEEQGSIFAELDDFGGILGLGHRDMSMASPWSDLAEDMDGHVTPFFEHLVQTRQLATPEFSMYMNAEKKQYSAILFGGVDSRVVQTPAADKKMFQLARVRGRGGATGEEPHYWSVELYRIVYNKDCEPDEKCLAQETTGSSEKCRGPDHPKCVDDPMMKNDPACRHREDGKCPKVFQKSFMKSLHNPQAPAVADNTGRSYKQDPALVFDSGTTLYTGPQAGVDEILAHIKPVQCKDIGSKIGTITYEVQGLVDPSDECDDTCPSEEDPTCLSDLDNCKKGKQFCADTSIPSTDSRFSERFGDCTTDVYNDNCRCLHKHRRVIDVVLQPHQYMVHDGGSGADVNTASCRPGFWTINVPEPNGPAWLLGELYMRHFVTVYRHEPPRQSADDNGECFRTPASDGGTKEKPWKKATGHGGPSMSKFRPRHCDPPLVAWAPARHSGSGNEQDKMDHKSFIKELNDMHPVYGKDGGTAASESQQTNLETVDKKLAELQRKGELSPGDKYEQDRLLDMKHTDETGNMNVKKPGIHTVDVKHIGSGSSHLEMPRRAVEVGPSVDLS